MAGAVSSLSRDTRIIFDALQRDAVAASVRCFPGTQMPGQHVPYRHSLLLVDGSPSRYLVAFARSDRVAVIEFQFGNPVPDILSRCTGVGKAADTDHIAALLIIGVGVEQIVADVFEYIL